jgi:hypothetical protein
MRDLHAFCVKIYRRDLKVRVRTPVLVEKRMASALLIFLENALTL